jgi:hypothetical protein
MVQIRVLDGALKGQVGCVADTGLTSTAWEPTPWRAVQRGGVGGGAGIAMAGFFGTRPHGIS